MELNRKSSSRYNDEEEEEEETLYSFSAVFDNEYGEYSINENPSLGQLFKKVESDANLEFVRGFLETSPDKYKLYENVPHASRLVDLLLASCEGYGMAAMLVHEYGACPGIQDTNNDQSAIDYAHERGDHTFAKFLELLADEQEQELGYFKKSRRNKQLVGPKTDFIKEEDV